MIWLYCNSNSLVYYQSQILLQTLMSKLYNTPSLKENWYECLKDDTYFIIILPRFLVSNVTGFFAFSCNSRLMLIVSTISFYSAKPKCQNIKFQTKNLVCWVWHPWKHFQQLDTLPWGMQSYHRIIPIPRVHINCVRVNLKST